MNKLLIVLLAVCLVSVHAFVKRDAETPQKENYLDKYQKELQDLSKNIGDKLQETFDLDEIKKGFNNIIDSVGKAIKDLKTEEAPKQ